MNDPTVPNPSEHETVSILIPWFVNQTIGELECKRVEAHLAVCAACREDLSRERQLFQRIAAAGDAAVEYLPGPSFQRLLARLDSLDGAGGSNSASTTPSTAAPAARALPNRRLYRLMAASVAVMAVALGLSAAHRWLQSRMPDRAEYYTVTAPAARPAGEAIRAVFAPTITMGELQAILAQSQLRIVAGPTDAGVYSLAPTSTLPVDSSLAVLRRQPSVRFAEVTQPAPGADTAR